jgi:hypothetical protein
MHRFIYALRHDALIDSLSYLLHVQARAAHFQICVIMCAFMCVFLCTLNVCVLSAMYKTITVLFTCRTQTIIVLLVSPDLSANRVRPIDIGARRAQRHWHFVYARPWCKRAQAYSACTVSPLLACARYDQGSASVTCCSRREHLLRRRPCVYTAMTTISENNGFDLFASRVCALYQECCA